uniref:Acid phosphatase n=1 Tax=Strongyloides venezuelensis TaxID=75913 RepID=A0A0K0FAE8_STRVS
MPLTYGNTTADIESLQWHQRVCVAGLILCNKMPYKDIKVTLYQKNIFGIPVVLKSVQSYCNANFILIANHIFPLGKWEHVTLWYGDTNNDESNFENESGE